LFLYDAGTTASMPSRSASQVPDYTLGRVGGGLAVDCPDARRDQCGPRAPCAQTNLVLTMAGQCGAGGRTGSSFTTAAPRPVRWAGSTSARATRWFQIRALSFLGSAGFVQLPADEQPGAAHHGLQTSCGGLAPVPVRQHRAEISRVIYGPQIEGISQGRLPNGATNQVSFAGTASPGASNYVAPTPADPNEILAINTSGHQRRGPRAGFVELSIPRGGV